MSKYPVSYWSESKKQDVDIEAMHDGHLCNAYRKLEKQLDADGQRVDMLFRCLSDEIADRGLDLRYPTGKPPAEQATTP